MITDRTLQKEVIARRVAKELENGNLVNLGIGIPTLVANYIPDDIEVYLQSENGIIGMGPGVSEDRIDKDMTNAGGQPVSWLPGAASIDSLMSFSIIRGGHLDVTVLGALEIDEAGLLSNWKIPGKFIPGMGGAMDLVTGAKRVIVAMTHTSKGKPKIVKKCSLPLTSIRKIDLIVTDMAVIEPTENGLFIRELAPDTTIEEVIEATEATLIVPEELKVMDI